MEGAHRCLVFAVCWLICLLLTTGGPEIRPAGWTRPLASSQSQSTVARVNTSVDSFARQPLDHRLPQAIVIGVRKCGTRALLEFLDIHPAIRKAKDEVHFFDDVTKYTKGLDWYRKQMPVTRDDQLTIEKSPAYFVTTDAPARIRAMNSSIKLIVIVRDPVTRLISDYAQLAANRVTRATGVSSGSDKMASFESLVLLPSGQVDMSYKPIRASLYALYFRKWLQMFKRWQLHVVDGDRLVDDPLPEVAKVESFLGVAHFVRQEHFVFNATKGFYCVHSVDPLTTGESTRSMAEKCLNESKGRKHPQVDPAVISTLRRFFAPYNRQFYSMVGQQFSWPEV